MQAYFSQSFSHGTKSLEEIAGVEEIPVSAAEPEVAQQIEKTIDPDRQKMGKVTLNLPPLGCQL